MYARSLALPDHSFFLFGPRGTGKTTWLRHVLPGALWKNLLLDEDYLPLVGDRSSLRAVRERVSAKFYLFDTGVARALAGRIRDPVTDLEVGKLLETFILHELRAAVEHQNLGGELSYWRSSGGLEVDFVWTRGDKTVAVEVKAAAKWHRRDGRALAELAASGAASGSTGGSRPSSTARCSCFR